MKPSRFGLGSVLAAAVWLANLNVAAETAANPQPPPALDLDAIIQPPVHPAEAPRVVLPAPAIPSAPPSGQVPNGVLAWDGEQKEVILQPGQLDAHFKFSFTNLSPNEVTIYNVHTSCGCTTVQMPAMPWKLAPGTNGEININMNVAGKSGIVFKTVTVGTDKGNKTLMVKAVITAPPAGQAAMSGRELNQQLALNDRQAVFKGDCARCHAAPAEGKMGKELFAATCAICHEAEHRASMVPDLRALKYETSRELWNVWVAYGKPGSLMPAFAKTQGGPLTDAQISSLVDYLAKTIPAKPVAQSQQAVVK